MRRLCCRRLRDTIRSTFAARMFLWAIILPLCGRGRRIFESVFRARYFYDDLQDEVRAAVDAALAVIGTLVAEVHDLQLDIPADRTVQAAESHAYHAENVARTPELYQAETVRRIRSGEKISAAEYIQRRQELDWEWRRARDFFAEVDLLVTPTTPIAARGLRS